MPSGIYKHKPHTEATKEILRQSKLGDKNPAKRPEVREKIRQAALKQFENGMPETTKEKMS